MPRRVVLLSVTLLAVAMVAATGCSTAGGTRPAALWFGPPAAAAAGASGSVSPSASTGPPASTSASASASRQAGGSSTAGQVDLTDPHKKESAMELVSSAENSSLNWRAQYKHLEDIGEARGYTAGIIGFCSGTGDMLDLVNLYVQRKPGSVLAKYVPALEGVKGSDSHAGLDPTYPHGLGVGRRRPGVPAGAERRT
jgi:chitosanase